MTARLASRTAETPPKSALGHPARDLKAANYVFSGLGVVLLFASSFALAVPQDLAFLPAIGFALAAVSGLSAVAYGSETNDQKISYYKVTTAVALASPIFASSLILVFQPTISALQFVAIVGGTAAFTGLFLGALLKSNVSGERRDAIDLALILVGLVGGATTIYGVYFFN